MATSETFAQYNLVVQPARPALSWYRLVDVWTTENGNWDKVGEQFRHYYQPNLGGDHHLYVKLLDKGGNPSKSLYDVVNRYGGARETFGTKAETGWAEWPLFEGTAYNPEKGEQGPLILSVSGGTASDWLVGVGLPLKHHISTFAVYREQASVSQPEPPTAPDIPELELPEPPTPPEPEVILVTVTHSPTLIRVRGLVAFEIRL